MNGPEHYRAAERLAAQANHFTYGDGGDAAVGAALAAEAQVHATLALAAATALGKDNSEWREATRPAARVRDFEIDPAEGGEPG